MNLYENLASQLKDAIRQGVYPPGDRVPSVRRLSSQHRVSQATVVAAYRLLESHGWLEARPQSGFFARHPESAPPAAAATEAGEGPCAVNVTELAVRLSRNTQRPDLVSLGAAVPHADFLPLADLRAALGRALRANADLGSRYSFPPGEEALRARIARRATEHGCAFGPEDVVITDLIRSLQLPIPVFVLDTGRLHTETLALLERTQALPGLTVEVFRPRIDAVLDTLHAADADAAVRAWLDGRGLRFPELVLDNGSGLSRRERLSAGSLARLLASAWQSPLMPEFIASLPLNAVDGTMRKRLNGNGIAGRAHIKTGTLEGVKTIAGYVLDKNGRQQIVVFLVNHANAGAAQAAQDALLAWVYEANP